MRFAGLLFFTLTISLGLTAAPTPTDLLSRVPVRFEPNRGQVHAAEPVQWMARGPEAAYAFTADGALIRTKHEIVRLRMQGANPKASYQPAEPFAAPTSYYTADYRGNIPGYQRLRRSSIYPGIDLVYYGKGTQLEYDFEVAPGADPALIRLAFEGGHTHIAPRLNAAGDLLIGNDDHAELAQRAPVIYQILAGGKRQSVLGSYRVAPDGTVTFTLGKYDRSAPLVIDPTVYYTQYFFGSVASTTAIAVTHDTSGNIYVAGNTQAADFYIQGSYAYLGEAGGQDAWVMKISPFSAAQNYVPFSTYYGGSGNEVVAGIAVDMSGIAYITGSTQSIDIPTSSGAYATTLPGTTGTFVAGFDTNQAVLTYGTYIGGTLVDNVAGIAILNEKLYITGSTTSPAYPTTSGAIETTPRGGTEVFISEIDPSKSGTAQLVASTYLPGSADDMATAIAVDGAGMVYVAGETGSPDIIVTPNAVQGTYDQSGDGFVAKVNLQTMQVLYGSYLGGSSYDQVQSVMVDPSGNIGLVGFTLSSDFPTTQNAYRASLNGSYVASFLAIMNPSAAAGSGVAGLTYNSLYGGSFADLAQGGALDANGIYYLTGYTLSVDLPTTTAALAPNSYYGGLDGFVAQIDPTKGLNGLLYGSYITGFGSQLASGIDVDSNGVVYVVGSATADVFGPQYGAAYAGDQNPGVLDGFFFAFHP